MKKQSFYNIWIENILYNSFSDKAILFRDNEIELIQYFFEHLDVFETEYPYIFEDLKKANFIIDADYNEIDNLLYQNRRKTLMDRNYHLTINPTLSCNYRCWYCCVEEQHTKYEERRMNDEIIKRINLHIENAIKVEHINRLHLDWFGGEPLMYFYEVVYPISKNAKELCEVLKVPFSNHVTTNAFYINDKMIDVFNEISLNSFQIPIDGDEKKHNSVKNTNNIGHYKHILEVINTICENVVGAHIVLRINYDLQTLKQIKYVINDIKKQNRNKILVDFQRVWQIPMNIDKTGNNQLLLDAKQEFEDAGFQVNYFAYSRKNFMCCYADNFYHRVINYDGKIFKCSARNYEDSLIIGILNEDGTISLNNKITSKMFAESTFRNDNCLKCKKLPLCFGPCIQKYYETKIGKTNFSCLQQASEISFENYVRNKIEKQYKIINQ